MIIDLFTRDVFLYKPLYSFVLVLASINGVPPDNYHQAVCIAHKSSQESTSPNLLNSAPCWASLKVQILFDMCVAIL
jgi:hypothetical protein